MPLWGNLELKLGTTLPQQAGTAALNQKFGAGSSDGNWSNKFLEKKIQTFVRLLRRFERFCKIGGLNLDFCGF